MCYTFDVLRPDYETKDNSLVIRRFFKFDFFVDLITNKYLYMCPSSEFEDKNEGRYSGINYYIRDNFFSKLGFNAKARKLALSSNLMIENSNRDVTVISCWTTDKPYSKEVWRSNNGVLIETNVINLRNIFGKKVMISPVQYIDYSKTAIPEHHPLIPFFYKDKKFSWEKEVRIIADMGKGQKIGTPRLMPASPQDLITSIYIKSENDLITQKTLDLLKSEKLDLKIKLIE